MTTIISVPRTPENVLLATFSLVGTDIKLKDDPKLAKIFNDAAGIQDGPFERLAWDEHYHVSDRLNEALQALDQAGSIVRENAAQTCFKISEHTAGPYGQSVLAALPEADQALIREVAAKIRDAFKATINSA